MIFMILSDQIQGIVACRIAPNLHSLPFLLRWCANSRGDSASTPRKFHDDVISYFSLSHNAI